MDSVACRSTSGRPQGDPCAPALPGRSTLCLLALTTIVLCSGCRSLRPSDNEGIFQGDWLSTDRIRGPLERALHNEEDALTRGEKFSPEALRQVEVARGHYDAKRHKEAIKAYKAIAKKYPETSLGEEAWFRMGESHFALNQYPKAQEAYDKLFDDYPSTRYVADASQRLFAIARVWLEVAEPVSESVIKTVSNQSEASVEITKPKSSLSAQYGLIPNFFDSTRPLFDTAGRAREALKSIWLNDPTGPLADDALMLTASYYFQRGQYLEADHYFQMLREEYSDSPHLEDAYVFGGHVKQVSYQGPFYDGTTLAEAEKLKEQTLNLFPESDERQKVRKDLAKIYGQQAHRAWSYVQFWERKENDVSVAIACQKVIMNYPDTRYAQMARDRIRKVNPKKIIHLPGMSDFLETLNESGDQLGPPEASSGPESSPSPRQGGVPGI